MTEKTYPTPNPHGVFIPTTCEVIKGHGSGWFVKIYVVETAENEWRSSYSMGAARFGASSMPNVHSKTYPSRVAAVESAIDKAIKYLASQNEAKARQMSAWLRDKKKQIYLLKLF